MSTNINKQSKLTFSFFLATAGALCFPQILNQKDSVLVFSNSIISVFAWLAFFYIIYSSLNTTSFHDRRGLLFAGGFSFLFTLAMLFGTRLDHMGSVNFKDWKLWVSIPVLTCLFAIIIMKLWCSLCRLPILPANIDMTPKHINALTFIFLILCWLPVLLAVYPGFFVYDANYQWLQVASRKFSAHHPLVHTLLLGGIICAVNKFAGSYDLGIFCYTAIQMVVMSCIFTYLLSYMRRHRVSRALRILSALYFAFFPVIVMFALCSTKDVLFTAALLLLLLSMLDMCRCGDDFFASKKKMLCFVLYASAMLLLRKNGIYAFVLTVPFLIIYNKKFIKKLSLLVIAALASYFLINSGLILAFNAENVERQEILTVPIQQLARTYKFNKEVFSQEDLDTLHEILPEQALKLYRPKLSDPVKLYFNSDAYSADELKYAGLWLRIGLKKPLSYINAWLVNSYGFWYPDTVIDVYTGNQMFTFTYQDVSYFGYEVEDPGTRDSKIPWLDEMYRQISLEVSKEKIPVISMMFSPGAMFWFFAFVLFHALYRKQYHLATPCLMVFFVWLTVIIGPTYLPRYVLIFWFMLPLSVAMLTEGFSHKP